MEKEGEKINGEREREGGREKKRESGREGIREREVYFMKR